MSTADRLTYDAPKAGVTASRDPGSGGHASAVLDLLRGRRVVVLAGAGCSTESGIPDYRGPESSKRRRKPMQYQEFVRSEAARARYWARSAVGWRRIATARPNAAHRALARLEVAGVVRGVITQNVDGLHHAAGSRRVLELHGSLAWVRCLACGRRVPRAEFQERLLAVNAGWEGRLSALSERRDGGAARDRAVGETAPDGALEQTAPDGALDQTAPDGALDRTAPDGDAELPDAAYADFRVPPCEACGGVMKPDVVFFGENVPRAWVEEAWRVFEEGEVLLVVGSSLAVFSGRRFVYRAQKDGMPIAVVNLGPTRADDVATVKVEGRVGRVLPAVAEALAGRG